jgi:hypothetical protein
MKQFLGIMLKDIQREGFTRKELFVYGVVAPLALIALTGFAGWIEYIFNFYCYGI